MAPVAQLPGQQIAIQANASVQTDDVRAAVDRLTHGRHHVRWPRRRRRRRLRPAADRTVADRGRRVAGDARPVAAARRAAGDGRCAGRDRHGHVVQPAGRGRDRAARRPRQPHRQPAGQRRAGPGTARSSRRHRRDRPPGGRAHRRGETELEQLLAGQRQLDDRVAMSTLTVDLTTTEAVVVRRRARWPTTRASSTHWPPGGTPSSPACSPPCSCWPPSPRSWPSSALLITLRACWSDRTPCAPPSRPRERHPSGVSTQSATVPSGKTNGARTPVWAYASGSSSGDSAAPQRCQRRAGTSASVSGAVATVR